MSEQTAVSLDIQAKDLDYARALAASEGVDLQAEEGFDPITITSITIIGATAAVATVSRLLDERRGGQVIDLRPGATRPLYRSGDLIFGLILIYLSDGTVRIEVKEPKGMFGQVLDVVTSIVPALMGQGANATAARLVKAVGGQADVAVSETPL